MTRKERTQQNRFDKKIAPIIQELADLCEKFEMPLVTSVQVYTSENGARTKTSIASPDGMSLPMMLSTSILNGSIQLEITQNHLKLHIPKSELKRLRTHSDYEETDDRRDDEPEPLAIHAQHCEDCNILMKEALARGERIDNIVVPRHDDAGLSDLIEELEKNKFPFIMAKNNIIH